MSQEQFFKNYKHPYALPALIIIALKTHTHTRIYCIFYLYSKIIKCIQNEETIFF